MKRNKRKAQAAVEFLMTYGWALMVALLTISALVYMGVFDISPYITERCEFSSSIYCIDSLAETSGVTVEIQNGFAVDITNVKVSMPECGVALGPSSLLSGEQGTYITNCTLPRNEPFKGTLYFNYTNPESGFNHTKIGRLIYKVAK